MIDRCLETILSSLKLLLVFSTAAERKLQQTPRHLCQNTAQQTWSQFTSLLALCLHLCFRDLCNYTTVHSVPQTRQSHDHFFLTSSAQSVTARMPATLSADKLLDSGMYEEFSWGSPGRLSKERHLTLSLMTQVHPPGPKRTELTPANCPLTATPIA